MTMGGSHVDVSRGLVSRVAGGEYLHRCCYSENGK